MWNSKIPLNVLRAKCVTQKFYFGVGITYDKYSMTLAFF